VKPPFSPRLATRRDGAVVVGCLLVIYALTLAPGLTPWDSGEFLSAIATLGVPHPPGTPLFVVVGRAWSEAFGLLPLAVALNLASAVATATACGLLALVFLRWAGRPAVIAGGIVAGTMGAVWQSATETEVYALALCMGALTLVVADAAGRSASARHRVLLAFLFGLSVALQISALVAGPAAILLLSSGEDGRLSWRASLAPTAAWTVAVGIGTVSPMIMSAGLLLFVVAFVLQAGARREVLLAGMCVLLGASFVFVMLVRARYDPGVNQGNPSTWQALLDVLRREQYDVPGLWPRRAPWWLQIGNLIQYADWQVAAGLSDAPGPSFLRTPFTLLMVVVGGYGAAWHRRTDRRSFRVLVCLLLCATLGVIAVLNLRAGPTYGWGVLAAGVPREARERDYFFGLAFAVCGLWMGLGAVRLALRAPTSLLRGVAIGVAALPLLLNWQANDRKQMPDAALAESLGVTLLQAAPPRAVLVTSGDNDSYAVWYAQHVLGRRHDVATVVSPLLGARWYREELRRRHGLMDFAFVDTWHGEGSTLAEIASAARRLERPIAVSVGAERGQRLNLGSSWTFRGVAFIERRGAGSAQEVVLTDTVVTRAIADTLSARGLHDTMPDAASPVGRYLRRLLLCPHLALGQKTPSTAPAGLLETACNY
jgi:hypothetical protein